MAWVPRGSDRGHEVKQEGFSLPSASERLSCAECKVAMVYLRVYETGIPYRIYKAECEYDAWSAIEKLVQVLRYEAKPAEINDEEFDGMNRQIPIMQRKLIGEERFV